MTKLLLKQKYLFLGICAAMIIFSTGLFIISENHLNFDGNDIKAYILNDEQANSEHDESFYRKLIKNENDEFLILTTDVMIKYAVKQDLINKNFFHLIHPLDLPFIANAMITVLDTRIIKNNIGPFRAKTHEDKYILYMAQAVPVFDNHGKIVLIGLVLKDISTPLGGVEDEAKDLSTYDRKELENLISMAD